MGDADSRDVQLVRKSRTAVPKVIEKLLDAGADPNAMVGGSTALCEAAAAGAHATVFVLLDRGAQPNKADTFGKTPLHVAALGGHLKTIKVLLQTGADVAARDKVGNTPLHEAARTTSDGTVNALLSAVTTDDALKLLFSANNAEESAVHTAARTGNAAAVRRMAMYPALTEAQVSTLLNKQNSRGQTALLQAASQKAQHAHKCVGVLVAHGADVTIADHKGNLPEPEILMERINSGDRDVGHIKSNGVSTGDLFRQPSSSSSTSKVSAAPGFLWGLSRNGSRTPRSGKTQRGMAARGAAVSEFS